MTCFETACWLSDSCSSLDVCSHNLGGQSPEHKAFTQSLPLTQHSTVESEPWSDTMFSALFIVNQLTFPFVIIYSFSSIFLGQTPMFLKLEIQLLRHFWIHKWSAVKQVNPKKKNLGLGSDSVAEHLCKVLSSISLHWKKKKKIKPQQNRRALWRGLTTPSITVCCYFVIDSIAKYCWI